MIEFIFFCAFRLPYSRRQIRCAKINPHENFQTLYFEKVVQKGCFSHRLERNCAKICTEFFDVLWQKVRENKSARKIFFSCRRSAQNFVRAKYSTYKLLLLLVTEDIKAFGFKTKKVVWSCRLWHATGTYSYPREN